MKNALSQSGSCKMRSATSPSPLRKIKDRPQHLLDQKEYIRLPSNPFAVAFDVLPDLLRQSLGSLGGIQPVTGAMAAAAQGEIRDKPSQGEIELFKKAGIL